ncbi:putative reverse transcriptase domain-containing protein [Tanacetum coccineum]
MPYLARSIWRIGLDSLECALPYRSSQICRIGNWSNALSCEVLALIRRISFVGYGVKLMLSDVKFRRPLADLRVSLEDLFFGNLHLEYLFMHEVEGRVDRLVEEVEELESKRAEVVDELASKTKEFNGKGGAVSYTHWVKKMEAMQDISGCGDNHIVKYSTGLLTGKVLTWWNSKVQTRGQEAVVGMTWEDFKELMKEEYCPSNEMHNLETEFWNHAMVELNSILKARVLTDEAVRNGSLRKSGEKRGDGGDPSKERNFKGDNKRTRTGKVFSTITNPVKKEYTGSRPKCTNFLFHHYPKMPCRICMNCTRLGHFAKDYKAGPKMVIPLNARNPIAVRGACYECGGTDHYKSACPRLNRALGQEGNSQNQALTIEGGQGYRNNGNPTHGRAFVMGADEARQDSNIVTGMFSLNNHYATMLFDSGADYSFVSTTFIPLLDINPSSLGLSYEIKIASRQLAEINKGRTGGPGIKPKVYHEKVVKIPLPHVKMHKVYGERPDEKVKHLMSAKAEEQKLKDIAIVQNFSEVFPNDLLGLAPSREVEFCINLIPRAMSVMKSPYHLAPTKMEVLLNQLMEFHDKGFIRPISLPWGAPFLGHVVNSDGIHVDPNKIKAVKNWEAPKSPTEKNKKYVWGDEKEMVFLTLKDKLYNAPILALLDGPEDFVVYCNASCQGLGCVLMQQGKVIAYASR